MYHIKNDMLISVIKYQNIPVCAMVFGGGTGANTTGKIELSI